MSYTSESTFRDGTRARDVMDVVEMLGYERFTRDSLKWEGKIASYGWGDREHYKSWVGVELSVYRDDDGRLAVSTRTRAGRSYWDLKHQNRTLSVLRRFFGGSFVTDAGTNRFWHPEGAPPKPEESGCYLAVWRFRSNMMRAHLYRMAREFPNQPKPVKPTKVWWIDTMNPRIISNNLLLPYVVATMEDYFKSTYVVLLRYSARKEAILKAARVMPHHLAQIAASATRVEDAVAEALPFQRPSAFLPHFAALDSKLDLPGALRKPHGRRKQTLLGSLEETVEMRHNLIHRSEIEGTLSDTAITRKVADVEASVERCYRRICEHRGWEVRTH